MSAQILSFPTVSPAPQEPEQIQEVRIVADCDDGYTRIANTLLEAICRVDLTARQMRVFMAIVRKTYGYQKKSDWVASKEIAKVMCYQGSQSHIREDVSALKRRKILVENGRSIGPNPVITDWIFSEKPQSRQPKKRDTNVPKAGHKCPEIGTKLSEKRDTQKKEINSKENINKSLVGKPDDSAREIIDYLNSTAGKKFKHTKTNYGFINARLKDGFTIDDLKTVVDKKTAEWSADPRMNQYLRPATLFNAEKCDGYLNAPVCQPGQFRSAPQRAEYNPDDTTWADGFDPFDPREL